MGSYFWFALIAVVAGLLWFVADMRYAQRWALKRAELGAQDKCSELDAHFQSGIKCRRPMLLIFQRVIIPGALEADYALHLSNQGEHERALILAQKASQKAVRRLALHLAVLPAESTILLRLGRYDDAKKVVQLGRDLLTNRSAELAKVSGRADLAAGIILQDAMIEMNLGHLDNALDLSVKASAASVSDPARAVISSVLCGKCLFKEALDALVYEPSGFYKFLDADGIELLDEDKVFRETARKMDEEVSSVFGPAIELGRALVFLESGDTANLGLALEQVESKLKSHRIMEHIFVRTRACWRAMKGDLVGVQEDLARTRHLAAEKPASRSAKYETHLAAGRAFFLLGQHDSAIVELRAAHQLALHPLEKHTSMYWLARANERLNQALASTQFKAVVADCFGTWMEVDARTRLG